MKNVALFCFVFPPGFRGGCKEKSLLYLYAYMHVEKRALIVTITTIYQNPACLHFTATALSLDKSPLCPLFKKETDYHPKLSLKTVSLQRPRPFYLTRSFCIYRHIIPGRRNPPQPPYPHPVTHGFQEVISKSSYNSSGSSVVS